MEERIAKMERKIEELQKVFFEIKASLKFIEKAVGNTALVIEKVTTHEEKHKVTENRLMKLENGIVQNKSSIDTVNLRIATATWVWAAAFFALQYFLTKM